jgi:transketolase
MIQLLSARHEPAYLRLGRSELDDESALPAYSPWRQLQSGAAGVIVAVGPIAGGLWRASGSAAEADRAALWVVSELGGGTLAAVPQELLAAIASAPVLGLVEEHVAEGGFGQQFVHALALLGCRIPTLVHAHARGYPSGRYGSQAWHRQECGLDVPTILARLSARA